MVKLIASDLDGTILRKGAQSVEPSTIKAIEQLVNKGMYFAPASGRQIVSLKRLFEPVSDKLVYIAENGALCEYKGEVIAKTPMDRKLALEIIEDVYEQPDCEVLISGQHTAYIKPKTEEYHYRMTKVVNYKTTLIDKFTDVDEDILKIAVCDFSGIDNSKEHFFSHRIHTSYSYKLYSYLFFYIFLKRLSVNIFCPYTASKHIFILFLSI